ncbi:MAG: hypothetical protein HQL65_15665 [Magnetococcales bacterium]|nr:hypothetical protein [Magnetococcales bacterium]
MRVGMELIILVMLTASHTWAGGVTPPSSQDCLACHRERDTSLVSAWEKSRHAKTGIACPACHGSEHDGSMANRSRRNDACTGCHLRETGSYTLSKHGVIVTLEAKQMDFSQPLQEGNQRAPTCAYCHLHAGEHDTGAGIFPLAPTDRSPIPDATARDESRAAPCLDCHAPRFVETWFTTGARMLEIGRMKVREATEVVARLDHQAARDTLHRMTHDHLRNVRLGVGHQSPDDQWWHGHPALDGDLLRLKSSLSDKLRQSTGP